MIFRYKMFLCQSFVHDKFRLYAVTPGYCYPKTCFGCFARGAVTIHIDRHSPRSDFRPVFVHQRVKPVEFGIVAAVGNIEHILTGNEAKGDNRIATCRGTRVQRLAAVSRQAKKEQEQSCKQCFSHHFCF